MNYIFFPFLMTISSCIYADFGLIQDKDGYVNVRELADLIYAELSGDFPLGDSRQPTYKSLRPFDLVS